MRKKALDGLMVMCQLSTGNNSEGNSLSGIAIAIICPDVFIDSGDTMHSTMSLFVHYAGLGKRAEYKSLVPVSAPASKEKSSRAHGPSFRSSSKDSICVPIA